MKDDLGVVEVEAAFSFFGLADKIQRTYSKNFISITPLLASYAYQLRVLPAQTVQRLFPNVQSPSLNLIVLQDANTHLPC